MCIYCTDWLRVISCQEQSNDHGCNISQNYACIRFFKIPKAKSGIRKHKNGKNNIKIYFFSFMRLCSKSESCNRVPQLFISLQSFFKNQLL